MSVNKHPVDDDRSDEYLSNVDSQIPNSDHVALEESEHHLCGHGPLTASGESNATTVLDDKQFTVDVNRQCSYKSGRCCGAAARVFDPSFIEHFEDGSSIVPFKNCDAIAVWQTESRKIHSGSRGQIPFNDASAVLIGTVHESESG